MKKLFFILMIALAMTAFVSCNKDNKSDNAGGGGSTTSSKLPDGYYAYETEDEDAHHIDLSYLFGSYQCCWATADNGGAQL